MSALSASQLHYLDHLGIDVWMSRDELAVMTAAPEEVTPPAQQVAQTLQSVQSIQPTQPSNTPIADPFANENPAFEQPQVPVSQPAQVSQTVAPQLAANSTNPVAPAAQQPAADLNITPAAQVASPLSAPAFPAQAHSQSSGFESTDQTGVEALAPAPEFNLQFWCYGSAASDGVWIVSDESGLTREHHMFAHNLAQFLEGKKRKPRHVGIFSWPMLDAPNVDQSEQVAQHYLAQHMEQLQNISATKTVISFKGCDAWLANSAHICLPYTLSEILQNPQHKRVIWQQLLAIK